MLCIAPLDEEAGGPKADSVRRETQRAPLLRPEIILSHGPE